MLNVRAKENVSRLLYVYKVGISSGCVICALMSAVCSLLFYDRTPGYFVSNIQSTLLQVFIAVSILFTLTVIVTMPKATAVTSPMSKDGIPAVSIIPACAFIYYAISLLPVFLSNGSSDRVYIVLVASTSISFIYFFLRTLDVKINTSALSLLGTASILSPIIIAVISYFDYTTVMNGPDKILLEFSSVMFSLLIINEVRFIWNSAMPRAFIAISGISSIVCLTCATNRICLLISNRELISVDSVALAILFTLLSAYSLVRVWLTNAYIPEEPEMIAPADTAEVHENVNFAETIEGEVPADEPIKETDESQIPDQNN